MDGSQGRREMHTHGNSLFTKQYNSGVLKKRETVHMKEIKEGLDGAARRINLYFEPFFSNSSGKGGL